MSMKVKSKPDSQPKPKATIHQLPAKPILARGIEAANTPANKDILLHNSVRLLVEWVTKPKGIVELIAADLLLPAKGDLPNSFFNHQLDSYLGNFTDISHLRKKLHQKYRSIAKTKSSEISRARKGKNHTAFQPPEDFIQRKPVQGWYGIGVPTVSDLLNNSRVIARKLTEEDKYYAWFELRKDKVYPERGLRWFFNHTNVPRDITRVVPYRNTDDCLQVYLSSLYYGEMGRKYQRNKNARRWKTFLKAKEYYVSGRGSAIGIDALAKFLWGKDRKVFIPRREQDLKFKPLPFFDEDDRAFANHRFMPPVEAKYPALVPGEEAKFIEVATFDVVREENRKASVEHKLKISPAMRELRDFILGVYAKNSPSKARSIPDPDIQTKDESDLSRLVQQLILSERRMREVVTETMNQHSAFLANEFHSLYEDITESIVNRLLAKQVQTNRCLSTGNIAYTKRPRSGVYGPQDISLPFVS